MAPFRISRPRFLAYFAIEGGLILAVLYGLAYATMTMLPGLTPTRPVETVLLIGGLFTAILMITQWGSPSQSRAREIILFTVISLLVGLVVFAGFQLLMPGHRYLSVLLLLEGAIAVPFAVAVSRWLSVLLAVDPARERILIVGTGESAQETCRAIFTNHRSGYQVIGFAAENDERFGTILAMGARIQTDYASLTTFAPQRVDRVIVALDEKRKRFPVRPLMELRLLGVEIEEATSFFERVAGKISVETMLPSWLIFSEGFKSSPLRTFLKRTVDLALSSVLLVLTTPLMLLTALIVKLDSRGPVFYAQDRMGQTGREFSLLKFRSMRTDAEEDSGPTWAQENDPRVTRVGRCLRKLRIDELPQLFNVFRGEMSFVGPRPERKHFVEQLDEKIPYYGLRMTVRPGITGWAQVEHPYGATDEDAREKLKYDLYYIKNGNLIFDLWVVLRTVKVVLSGSGAR